MQSFNCLLASLDVRGNREANLHSVLQRVEARFKESINKMRVHVAGVGSIDSNSPSSSFSIPNTNSSELSSSFAFELGRSGNEIAKALKRYEDFEKWMWGECSNLRAMKFGNTRCEHLLRICENCRDLSLFEDDQCSSCQKLFQTLVSSDLPFSNHISQFKENMKQDSDFYSQNRDSGCPVRLRLLKAQLALIEVRLFTLFTP